jgi:hypothetical protein
VTPGSQEHASSVDARTIDSRMKDTLAKLSLMEGQRFYFVGTAGMAMRAETKVRRANWSIKVVQI